VEPARTDREPTDLADGGRGHRKVLRWNPAHDWVISKKMAHAGLVSEADFVAAQAVRAARPTSDGATRTYLLAGLLRCRLCGRRMDAHWVNDRPGYRCRHGHTSAKRPAVDHPKNLYLREDHVLTQLATALPHASGSRDPHKLAGFLRSSQITIICDGVRCCLSSENSPDTAHPQGLQTLW
jgi:site-specific DNA recombinase